ncbi:MAG: hypothetical protein P8Y63_02980 [Deltaproteobacteria bacterium]|jgi:hypothetical protein
MEESMLPPRLLLMLFVFLMVPVPSVDAKEASHVNKILLAATSPFEDMVDFALAQNDAGITKALAVADRQAASVKVVLPPAAAGSFGELLQTIHEAAAGKEYQSLAVTAVEVIRFLLDGLRPSKLKVPKEVGLLDYAGFRLRVLATAKEPDWDMMLTTAEDATKWWNGIESRVSDKALRKAFSTAISGLQEAAKKEDLPMLRLAAQIELDLVDMLEHHFRRKS